MALMEWLPLALGGIAVYWLTARLASFVMRGSKEPILAEHERASASRESRESRVASKAKPGFSLFKKPEASSFKAKDPARRRSSSTRKPPIPATTIMPLAKRREVNREIAAKINTAAVGLETAPASELPQELLDTAPLPPEDGGAQLLESEQSPGPIPSLDFTLDETVYPGMAAVELSGMNIPVSPLAMADSTDADEIGKTLLLDTEELLRAIRGGGTSLPPMSSLSPVSSMSHESTARFAPSVAVVTAPFDFELPQTPLDFSTAHFSTAHFSTAPLSQPLPLPLPEMPDTVPGATPDWTRALDGLNDWTSAAPEAAPATFFSAPMQGRDMATTQMFRVDSLTGAAAPAPASVPASAPASVPASVPQGNAPNIVPSVALTPASADEFHVLAVAHEDIQSARVVLEELMELSAGAADPIFRALVFGAIVTYARPFLANPNHPVLANFSSARFAHAHQELLEARHKLIDQPNPLDDQLVRVPRDGAPADDPDATYAVRTDILILARLPIYIALCNFLELRIVERLEQISALAA